MSRDTRHWGNQARVWFGAPEASESASRQRNFGYALQLKNGPARGLQSLQTFIEQRAFLVQLEDAAAQLA